MASDKSQTTARDDLILEVIEDAICEGAREWDAYANPETKHTAQKALARIKEIINAPT